MDVNSTKFHLLLGRADWESCTSGQDVKTLGEIRRDKDINGTLPQFDWNEETDEIRLRKHLFKFTASPKDIKPDLTNRRGAARDRYGNWYWIDENGLKIKILSNGSKTVSDFYPVAAGECAEASKGNFKPVEPIAPKAPVTFQGLAVTIDHYLVVGTLEPAGLLVFDLFSTGEPRQILWRKEVEFVPFDITARYSGGVFVLDRKHKRYWMLDRGFSPICGVSPQIESPDLDSEPKDNDFQPVDESETRQHFEKFHAEKLYFDLPPDREPISIEALPDDTVLILNLPQDEDFSVIYRYRLEDEIDQLTTESIAAEVDEEENQFEISSPPKRFRMRGYDIAFVKGAEDGSRHGGTAENEKDDVLFIATEEGNQAFAFRMGSPPVSPAHVSSPPDGGKHCRLYPIKEYFPMRLFGGKGFAAADDGKVYFDFGERWLPLIKQNRPSFETEGTLETRIFDGKDPNCVWHRLMLDGCIPRETKVEIYSRTGADKDDLSEWRKEPNLYFRGNGSEIPFFEGWAVNGKNAEKWELALQRFKERFSKEKGKGTWELLLQRAKGRYLQLRLVFSGNGQQTPRISALRVYYPRFSYLKNYLPSIYREDEQSAFFLDRFLANVEGLYTTIEDKIAAAQMLFDIRSAPTDALDWLANWFGVALDPAWTEDKRRLFISHANEFFQYRGTLRGLRMALRLALDTCADERIFEFQTTEQRARDPIRIVERFLTRRTPGLIPADLVEEPNLPRIGQETSKWTPEQSADVLHQRYREKLAEDLARELLMNLGDITANSSTERLQKILEKITDELAAHPEKNTDAVSEKQKRIPTEIFPAIKPADAREAAVWESLALEALEFVPSDTAAKEKKRWQDFLRGKYQTKIADLDAAHGTNYSTTIVVTSPPAPAKDPFLQIFLPHGSETNVKLKADWQEFLVQTKNSGRDRALWQDFMARRYRRIGQLNSSFGTNWSSFETVSLFDRLPSLTKPLGDWMQFESTVIVMHLTAHRFTVLIPATLSGAKRETPEEQNRKLQLVSRVVDLEKPAHTICDFRYYWNLFRVEEVRLGLDTLLGLGSRDPQLNPVFIAGESYAGESRLGLPQPEKYSSRFVLDSERLKTKK